MAYQFFNIGKANARIEDLEKELATAKAAPGADASKIAELTASNNEISALLEKATADLAAANNQMATMAANHNASITKITAESAALVAAAQASAGQKAAEQAQKIAASTGAPAAPVVPASAAGPKSELKGFARMAAAAKRDLDAVGWKPKQ